MINLGIIERAPCENLAPPPDARCSDPAFALNNPAICGAQAELIIKPSFAVACELGSVQFKAFVLTSGSETDVTDSTVFSTSDPAVAVVGATSGNATGMGAGAAQITASYQGMTATAEFSVMAGTDCCASQSVAFLIFLDLTKSMKSVFGAGYSTRLKFAKYAAGLFVGKVDTGKDTVGAMGFTALSASTLWSITANSGLVSAAIAAAAQTNDTTAFYDALTAATAALDAATADRKVLVIISDGEDEEPAEKTAAKDPIILADDWKSNGGIIICLGVRASTTANGFPFLSALATGGFFVNATPATAAEAVDYLTGLMGYLCAGDCTPSGDVVAGQGALDFDTFVNWDVIGGHVDLLGNGFFDVLPGNDLYVNLAGTTAAHDGLLRTKNSYHLTAGHLYRLTVKLAGNQIEPASGAAVSVALVSIGAVDLLNHIVLSNYTMDFTNYVFSFTPAANDDVYVEVQEDDATAPADPRWGCLLKQITLEDVTGLTTLFTDDFSGDNLVYILPKCGWGTTYFPGYGYYYGYDCAYLNTCLTEPPPIQAADPSPLPDIEGGPVGPGRTYTSNKQSCASCPVGYTNVSQVPLLPASITNSGAQNIQAVLSGLTWQMPVGDPTATLNPASVAHDPADQTAQITGITGDLFTVGLHIRGLAELKTYPYFPPGLAAVPVAGTGARCVHWLGLVNGAGVCLPGDNNNEYSLQISDPTAFYLLNAWGPLDGVLPPHGLYLVDYQFNVQIRAGATVMLRARAIDAPVGFAWPNSTGLVFPANLNVNQTPPFPGQFLQMDVGTITGGSVPPILPYTRKFTFAAATTVDNYLLEVPAGSVNYPTDWTLEGSNDDVLWSLLDARSGVAFVPHPGQTMRYPIQLSAAYLYYRLLFTDTSDGNPPSLSAANLYAAADQAPCQSADGSGTSQAAADNDAKANALSLAQAALNCVPLYQSAQVSYDATCLTSGGTVTRSASAKSYISQSAADQSALDAAKAMADAAALEC
jgi:hypothetical protein